MSVDHYPGEFRVGVLNENMSGIVDPSPAMLDPKFLVLILLRGRQQFRLAGELIELAANPEDDLAPVGFVTLIKEPCELVFEGSWGAPFRKISIAGPTDWFAQMARSTGMDPALPNFPSSHLEHRIWRPGKDIIRLANQIILAPPEETSQQLGLFRMSRALEILRRIPAEQDLLERAGDTAAPAGSDLKAQERIRLFILQNLSEDLSLQRLEVIFGLNRRSIQRGFKQEYGVGLSDFIRKSRLDAANLALQKDGVSLSAAAFMAGYSSAANFSTAFRREFGVSPASVRNKAI